MRRLALLLMSVTMLFAASMAFAQSGDSFTFGLLMVGPYNDHGWSEANYIAGKYVENHLPGTKMIYLDNVNPSNRPGTTASQLAESLVAKGAKLIIFSSDDMSAEAVKFAQANPNIYVIMTSGDQVWKNGRDYQNIPNMVNIMGKMVYMKMVAGVAAAMTTKTGKIAYLGPLVNDETRRLASSVYLGAKYAWVNYLHRDPSQLKFKVTWIGYWFNIPGVTSDPTQVADDFFNSGYDVVVSGIDTTEAVTEATRYQQRGMTVWAIPYDYINAISEGPSVSLGVPYFNWGPAYVKNIEAAMNGQWKSHFEWNGPDWSNINSPTKSAVGFNKGSVLSPAASAAVDRFIASLGNGLKLWKGPLNLQDGTQYLSDGQVATEQQIWYLPQLLQGMQGQSTSK